MSLHLRNRYRTLIRFQNHSQILCPSHCHCLNRNQSRSQYHCLFLIQIHSPFPSRFRCPFRSRFQTPHCYRIGFDNLGT